MAESDSGSEYRKPTREVALQELSQFLKRVTAYEARRNYVEEGRSAASGLSPFLRRRLLLEEEVLAETLQQYPFAKVEKFVQEVVWRTYWKGWLESRPEIWENYLTQLDGLCSFQSISEKPSGVAANGFHPREFDRARAGETNLPYFNDWVRELKQTGYLHNHARMWFASIWIFTLELPWQLGAQFFLEHLLDGDPASNTLSWRWVAGLQTVGKHYVATPSNIRQFTENRVSPGKNDLAKNPQALPAEPPTSPHKHQFFPASQLSISPQSCFLLHEEDLSPEIGELSRQRFSRVFALEPDFQWASHSPSDLVKDFIRLSFDDAVHRLSVAAQDPVHKVCDASDVQKLLTGAHESEVCCFRPLVGFLRKRLEVLQQELQRSGVTLRFVDRVHDVELFPFSGRGFFPFWQNVRERFRLLPEKEVRTQPLSPGKAKTSYS